MNRFYVCYDINQKRFFRSKGISDLIYGLHPKTYSKFWVYERNDYFNRCFDEWMKMREIIN